MHFIRTQMDQSEQMIQMLENFLRPYIEKTPLDLELVLGISKICSQTILSMWQPDTIHFTSILVRPPPCTINFHA